MERNKRFFIVSFGNSREYIYEAVSSEKAGELNHSNPLEPVEKEIKEYLDKLFPGQPLAYFETPKVTEIREADLAEYKDYPKLDADAIKEIEEVLKKGISIRQDNNILDSDAPYSDVN